MISETLNEFIRKSIGQLAGKIGREEAAAEFDRLFRAFTSDSKVWKFNREKMYERQGAISPSPATNVLLYADDPSVSEPKTLSSALFTNRLRCGTAILLLQALRKDFPAAARKPELDGGAAQRQVGTP